MTYRLYSFVNYYLSPIQYGIQTAHVVGEMAQRNAIYRERYPNEPETAFEQWCRRDKTIIVLKGGNAREIGNLYYKLDELFQETPAAFREDEDSLARAFTAVGILIPNMFWNREENPKWDHEEVVKVRKFLEKYPLA
jgi:predicted chitinase